MGRMMTLSSRIIGMAGCFVVKVVDIPTADSAGSSPCNSD